MKHIIRYVATPTSVKKITLTVVRATDKKVNFFPTKIIRKPN